MQRDLYPDPFGCVSYISNLHGLCIGHGGDNREYEKLLSVFINRVHIPALGGGDIRYTGKGISVWVLYACCKQKNMEIKSS